MRYKLSCLLFLIQASLFAQSVLNGIIYDENSKEPLPFATILTSDNQALLSSAKGEFSIEITSTPYDLKIKYLGYQEKKIVIESQDISNLDIFLNPKEERLDQVAIDVENNAVSALIKKAISRRNLNNPEKKLNGYSYKGYNKFKITKDSRARFEDQDTTNVEFEKIFNQAHSFLSEKVSTYRYQKGKDEKENVLASRMTGFKEPVYDVLGIRIQSHSLYKDKYVIFNNEYAGPLSRNATQNYYYKILDTTNTAKPAYVVLFQPRRAKAVASLEGILYLDVETLAIQKAVAELKGELDVKVVHNFQYIKEKDIWFPKNQEINIRPGIGKKKVALFGGQISIGRLGNTDQTYTGNNDFLTSRTDYFDIDLNDNFTLKNNLAAIEIASEADQRSEDYWNKFRTTAITEKDVNTFRIADSIVKAQKIERKINVIQSFNIGYYPVGFFDFDLTYPIKYNNYEGLRLGLGGITNKKFSNRFRLEGYGVYGFKDREFKYGVGGGVLLNRNTGTWFNINYIKDIREVGSFFYLTDRRVYSLFEPRLVNIDFYYKHRTWSTSLQHRVIPKLLSETQFSINKIEQTTGYRYLNDGISFSTYNTAEATLALRWSPFSKFLDTPQGTKEIFDGFPKITAQYTKGLKGVADSDFSYSKLGIKAEYQINRLNQTQTSFLLEGDLGFGDLPLTHLFHTYPNAPTRETILQRFSVAGRRSFETMFFSEFFSDRLATLQIRHRLRPLKIASWLNPEIVLISRYAIGDVSNIENHQNINFNSLQHGYQESGFEINKLFAGFGLSFAYRYGAYHLPNIGDNFAFKFTFYLKL